MKLKRIRKRETRSLLCIHSKSFLVFKYSVSILLRNELLLYRYHDGKLAFLADRAPPTWARAGISLRITAIIVKPTISNVAEQPSAREPENRFHDAAIYLRTASSHGPVCDNALRFTGE